MKKIMETAALAAAVLVCATAAKADCELRKMTEAESKHQARVAQALTEALPKAPQGWTLVVGRKSEDDQICADSPEGGFEISVRADYRYQPSKDEAAGVDAQRKALRKQIEALDVLPPAVKAEQQGWLDKMSVANRESNAAYKAGDKALASKKSDEADGYSRKGREVRDRYRASVRAQKDALEARIKALNEGQASVAATIAANELFPSAPAADVGSQIAVGKVPAPRTGGLKVHGVRLVLEGPAARRGLIEAAVDRKKLEALVR